MFVCIKLNDVIATHTTHTNWRHNIHFNIHYHIKMIRQNSKRLQQHIQRSSTVKNIQLDIHGLDQILSEINFFFFCLGVYNQKFNCLLHGIHFITWLQTKSMKCFFTFYSQICVTEKVLRDPYRKMSYEYLKNTRADNQYFQGT